MIHRHLDYLPETPVEELPSAAIVDLLDRGDLDGWRPIAAAVARAPHGPFALRVARLLDAYPMYGTSALWRAWLERCRARMEGQASIVAPTELAALRRRRGFTQVELARRMGMSQSDLSKLERRRDVRLSTLRAYAEALRGKLRVLVVSRRGDVEAEIVLKRG